MSFAKARVSSSAAQEGALGKAQSLGAKCAQVV